MSFVIRPTQLAVATYLKEHGPSTVKEIVQHTGMTEASVKNAILVLRKQYPIETYRVGTGASFNQVAYWWVSV
jgi:DNA-binding MarR family transcriptional regulator